MIRQSALDHPGCRPGGYAALRVGRCLTMAEPVGGTSGPSSFGADDFLGEIRDTLIICRNGRIESVGPWKELRDCLEAPPLDFRENTLCPGLVNAHTHVNLSHARGNTVSGRGFIPWVVSLVKLLRTPPSSAVLEAAVRELAGCATVLAGDIAGFHAGATVRAFSGSPVQWAPMAEFIGPGEDMRWPRELPEPDFSIHSVRGISGHALYSTSAEVLRQAKAYAAGQGLPYVMHLGESPDETEMFVAGSGEMLGFYTRAGFVSPHFSAPGIRPVAYAHALGLLDSDTLAVHCTQADMSDIALLESSGAAVCLCPRSNQYIGVGRAPWSELFAASIPLCIGTDGLCSNAGLDLFEELRFMAAHWTDSGCTGRGPFPWHRALEAITRTPARILKADHLYGSIVPGKSARLTVLPPDIAAKIQFFRLSAPEIDRPPQTPHGVESGQDIVDHDPVACREPFFRSAYGPGFGNVEQPEQGETCSQLPQSQPGKRQKGDPLAQKFVNDDLSGIFAAHDPFRLGSAPPSDKENQGQKHTFYPERMVQKQWTRHQHGHQRTYGSRSRW